MSEVKAKPPAAASQLAQALESDGWHVGWFRTTGAGNHPTRGYVRAHFCKVYATKGEWRIDAEWVAEQADYSKPGWTPDKKVGRWAQARPIIAERRRPEAILLERWQQVSMTTSKQAILIGHLSFTGTLQMAATGQLEQLLDDVMHGMAVRES